MAGCPAPSFVTLPSVHSVPSKVIVPWGHAQGMIPVNWNICDGTNGTPDLRGMFVMAAGHLYNPGDTGGSTSHTHDFTADSHKHTVIAGPPNICEGPPNDTEMESVQQTGETDNTVVEQPYYALCYIQRA